MATLVSENLATPKVNFDVNTLTSEEVISFIETRINNIIEEDKKLENPVFLFIGDGVIAKLAYFLAGYIARPVAVGIAGQSASGKSTITQDIIDALIEFQEYKALGEIITRINTDDYYYDRSKMVKAAGSFAEFAKKYDLDVPAAFELSLLKQHIKTLLLGEDVLLPKYDMSGTAKRFNNHTLAKPNKIVITEGLFCLTDTIKDVFDFCIYVDVTHNVQKDRWFARAEKRNIVGDAAEKVFNNVVDKAKIHIKPTAQNADIIINGEAQRQDYKDIVAKFLNVMEMIMLEKLI